jgi:hypothetical protein
MDQGAYCNSLGSRFHLNSVPVITLATLRKSQIAVTLIVNDNPNLGRTLPIPFEEAFLVHLMTRDCLAHAIWLR